MNVGKSLRWQRDGVPRVKLERVPHDEKNVLRCHLSPRLGEPHPRKSLFFSPCPIDNNYCPVQEYPCQPAHRLVTPTFFLASYPPFIAFDFRLIDPGREFLHTKYIVHYGLMERCERQVLRIPDPDGDWQEVFTAFKCRDFPKSVSDRCEKENRLFCVEWTSAGYLAHMALGFSVMALFSLLIGVSTHSRRRRVWKAVAGLVTFNGAWPIFVWLLMRTIR
jgi:hypothetical protein